MAKYFMYYLKAFSSLSFSTYIIFFSIYIYSIVYISCNYTVIMYSALYILIPISYYKKRSPQKKNDNEMRSTMYVLLHKIYMLCDHM